MSKKLIIAIAQVLAPVGFLIFTFAGNEKLTDYFFGLSVGIWGACFVLDEEDS